MSPDKLVYMANQIGKFFASQGRDDEATAVAGIETHLRKFWDPRMRREIVAHLHAGGGGLCDTARSAVALMAEQAPAVKAAPPTPT